MHVVYGMPSEETLFYIEAYHYKGINYCISIQNDLKSVNGETRCKINAIYFH